MKFFLERTCLAEKSTNKLGLKKTIDLYN